MEERFAEIKGMEKMYAAVPEFSFWGVFYHIMFLQAEIIQNQNTGEAEKRVILELENMDNSIRVKLLFEGVSLFYMAGLDSVGGFDIDKNPDYEMDKEKQFLIIDYESNAISFYCREIEVLDAERRIV